MELGGPKRFLLVAVAIWLLAAPRAMAETSLGSACVANGSEKGWTALSLGRAGSPFQSEAWGDGVITHWRVEVAPGRGGLAQRLRVLRPFGGAYYAVVSESAIENVVDGVNDFPARIPIESRDHIGLYGPRETLLCKEEESGKGAIYKGVMPLGAALPFTLEDELGVPVIAGVEPDIDDDGYGDETQDECPESRARQASCPPVAMRSKAEAKRRSIIVRVGVTSRATIEVYGQVAWRLRPHPKFNPAGSMRRRLIVALNSPAKTVLPGKRVPIRIPLPRTVLRRLGELPPKKVLTAKLTVLCTDLAERTRRQRIDVNLRGQGSGPRAGSTPRSRH